MKKLGCICAVALLLFFMGMIGALPLFEPPLLLLFGWTISAVRFVHAWHFSAGAVALFVFAVILLVTGSHAFLRWLYRSAHRDQANAGAAPTGWRWKWTLCGYGIGACSLIAIACVVLTIHQVYWMSRSSEPWYENRSATFLVLSYTAHGLTETADACGWDSTKTRAAFWAGTGYGRPPGELLQPIWIPRDQTTLQAILLVPRQELTNRVNRFALMQPGTNIVLQPLGTLPTTLARLGVMPKPQKADKPEPLLP